MEAQGYSHERSSQERHPRRPRAGIPGRGGYLRFAACCFALLHIWIIFQPSPSQALQHSTAPPVMRAHHCSTSALRIGRKAGYRCSINSAQEKGVLTWAMTCMGGLNGRLPAIG